MANTLPLPEFIERDGQQVVSDLIAAYEAQSGRRLFPAQVERLLIDAFAYRETLIRERIQYAAMQNLVAFADAPALDYLGQLVGVTRLPASRAFCRMQFTLVAGHGALVIPQGLRVSSIDGRAVFQTVEATEVDAGVLTVELDVECQSEGSIGNGYLPNTVTVVMDPQAYLTAVTNLEETQGGGDQESDDQLRERIKLAPASFSVAGPKGAYKFFALSASPLLIDAAVLGPEDGTSPGVVEIYPLVASGTTPQQLLDAVLDACSADNRRPVCDTVRVYAPTIVTYDIEVNLTLLVNTDQNAIVDLVTANLTNHAAELRKKLGKDVVLTDITRLSKPDGVYDVAVVSPLANIVVPPNACAQVGTITVNVIGTANG